MDTTRSKRSSATPTIRDVARVAGVAIGTASKALNANGRLRQETRDRVLEAAGALGYRPNSLAQSLHRSKSMTIGILSTDSFGRFVFPIVEALEDQLSREGIGVFMCNATEDPERERRHLDQLLGKRIDGLIITARRSDKRAAIGPYVPGLPVIYVFTQADDPGSLSLLPDDEGGARMATEHLISLGRTRIAHFTGPAHFEAVSLRHRGYAQALAAAGLPELPGYFRHGKWSEASGRDAVAALFDGMAEVPDALFCGNDQIARGVLDALRDRDIAVPEAVSVVGFDNWTVMAEGARPPLTSIDMNLEALGREAGRQLMAMIAGEHVPGVRRLPCTLVVRESSRKSKQQAI